MFFFTRQIQILIEKMVLFYERKELFYKRGAFFNKDRNLFSLRVVFYRRKMSFTRIYTILFLNKHKERK